MKRFFASTEFVVAAGIAAVIALLTVQLFVPPTVTVTVKFADESNAFVTTDEVTNFPYSLLSNDAKEALK